MTENFNMIYKEMVDLSNDQNTSINTVSKQINDLSTQIADLNKQIYEYERSGQKANDLRDARNSLLDSLSGYANISYEEDNKGMVNVSLCGRNWWMARSATVSALPQRQMRLTAFARTCMI